MSVNGVNGYNSLSPYNNSQAGYGGGGGGSSVEAEAAKADALQVEKLRLANKATYQNNYSQYVTKLQ